MYPSFALEETFPRALILLTWLIPKCPTAEVQIQSNVLLFHDEFILKSPALTKLILRQKTRFSLPNSSSLVLLCLSSNIIKLRFSIKESFSKIPLASVGTSQMTYFYLLDSSPIVQLLKSRHHQKHCLSWTSNPKKAPLCVCWAIKKPGSAQVETSLRAFSVQRSVLLKCHFCPAFFIKWQ